MQQQVDFGGNGSSPLEMSRVLARPMARQCVHTDLAYVVAERAVGHAQDETKRLAHGAGRTDREVRACELQFGMQSWVQGQVR